MYHSTIIIALVVGSLCCSGLYMVAWTAASMYFIILAFSLDVLTLLNNARSISPQVNNARSAATDELAENVQLFQVTGDHSLAVR